LQGAKNAIRLQKNLQTQQIGAPSVKRGSKIKNGGFMTEENRNPQQVAVTDVHMPFWSMVVFMVKWAVAAIPAFFILALVAVFIYAAVPALVSGLTSASHSAITSTREGADTRTVPVARPTDELAAYDAASVASHEATKRCIETTSPEVTKRCVRLLKDCSDGNPGAVNDPLAARALASCMDGVRP
jgi:hypothetical protein